MSEAALDVHAPFFEKGFSGFAPRRAGGMVHGFAGLRGLGFQDCAGRRLFSRAQEDALRELRELWMTDTNINWNSSLTLQGPKICFQFLNFRQCNGCRNHRFNMITVTSPSGKVDDSSKR
ncbi:hypothetical protein FEM03_06015 [Phragmitibacter flavus]|uniref:Uncharacterized protein n=1 Tax=Phragmitibacter flavus TaxID=2576071 RepID=A0A5R8KHD5_9BACT|nr:hypothetical protein [Phragmitibacter flavus]TLD71692.1 hypothetical protein FEM03_06015 [Phragmitibacter flavus]